MHEVYAEIRYMVDKIRDFQAIFCCNAQLEAMWFQISRSSRDILTIIEARRDLVQDAHF